MSPLLADKPAIAEAIRYYEDKPTILSNVQFYIRDALGSGALPMKKDIADGNFVRNVMTLQQKIGERPDGVWTGRMEERYGRWDEQQMGTMRDAPVRSPKVNVVSTGEPRERDMQEIVARRLQDRDTPTAGVEPARITMEDYPHRKERARLSMEFQLQGAYTDKALALARQANRQLMTITAEMKVAAGAKTGSSAYEEAMGTIQDTTQALNDTFRQLGFRNTVPVPKGGEQLPNTRRTLQTEFYPAIATLLVQAMNEGKLGTLVVNTKGKVEEKKLADIEDLGRLRAGLTRAAISPPDAGRRLAALKPGSPLFAYVNTMTLGLPEGDLVAGVQEPAPAAARKIASPITPPRKEKSSVAGASFQAPPAPAPLELLALPAEIGGGTTGSRTDPFKIYLKDADEETIPKMELSVAAGQLGTIHFQVYAPASGLGAATADLQRIVKQTIQVEAQRRSIELSRTVLEKAGQSVNTALTAALTTLAKKPKMAQAPAPQPTTVPAAPAMESEPLREGRAIQPPAAARLELPPEVKGGNGSRAMPFRVYARRADPRQHPYEIPFFVSIGFQSVHFLGYPTKRQMESLSPGNPERRKEALAEWQDIIGGALKYYMKLNPAEGTNTDEGIEKAKANLYKLLDKAIADLRTSGVKIAGY